MTFDAADELPGVFPQVSVLGRVLEQAAPGFSTKTIDGRLYLNTNAPMSGVVCGVQVRFSARVSKCPVADRSSQGSGKSHTSSVILENFLIKDKMLGTSKGGLAGLVYVQLRLSILARR